MAMDAITPKNEIARAKPVKRPSQEEAEEAVRTLNRVGWRRPGP
jgi:GTP cyclohydrolase I